MTNGSKITLDMVNEAIAREYYYNAERSAIAMGMPHDPELGTLTICVLVLKNGFKVLGQSSCAELSLYDEELGRTYARDDAIRQVWTLMGYALREKLHRLQSLEQAGLGEALTRMTAFGLGNSEAFRMQDADRILSHFLHERSEEGGAVIEESLKTAVDLANLPVVSAEEPPMFFGYHEVDQAPEPEENEPEGA